MFIFYTNTHEPISSHVSLTMNNKNKKHNYYLINVFFFFPTILDLN